MKEKIVAYFKGMHVSWTIWFGYLLIALPFVQAEWHVWSGLVPERLRPYVLSLIGLVVILLRFKSTQSLDKRAQG